MKQLEGSLWSIEYHGHCPDGWPKVLAEMFIIGYAPCPQEIKEFPITLGGGYSITHSWVSRPIKPLHQESLANVRKKRAKRRIMAKYPMFADQFIKEELLRKPDYYNGITDMRIHAEYESAREEYEKTYNDRLSRPGILIILAKEPVAAKIKAAEVLESMAKAR